MKSRTRRLANRRSASGPIICESCESQFTEREHVAGHWRLPSPHISVSLLRSQVMPPLADSIRQCKNRICEVLHVGYANWDDLLDRIERQEGAGQSDFSDEQVWTFLVACAYSMGGEQGVNALAQILTEQSDQSLLSPPKLWFEVLPLPPRVHEGNTHLDLALGNIALRSGTQSGIELGTNNRSWICFVECK